MHAEANADLLKEVVRRHSTREDPNEVVRQFAFLALDIENRGVRLELDRVAIEEDFDFTGPHAVFDSLRIAFLDAAELRAAVAESVFVAGLVRESHGSFDRTVSAADDEDLLVDVVVGLDQPVHHFGQFFSWNAEFARGSSFAQSENDGARAIVIGGRPNREAAVFVLGYLLDLGSGNTVKVGAIENHVPEREQVFLGGFCLLEFAVHGKFDRAGHHQLLAWILGDRTADLILFECKVIEFALDGAEGCADTCRPGADNQHVVNPGRCRHMRSRATAHDGVHTIASLIDSVLDQGQAAELSDDEEILDAAFG